MRIVFFMEAHKASNAQDKSRASHGGDGPPLQEHDGHMPSIWYYSRGVWQIILRPVGHPTALEVYGVGLHPRNLSSGFMTVGDADTLWRPHFFSAVTFESQRSPGYFRIVASLVNLYFGSHHAYSLYARPLNLACYRLGQSGDSDVDAYHKFFKFISLQ